MAPRHRRVAVPLRGFSFYDGNDQHRDHRSRRGVAIHIRGFSFCDLSPRRRGPTPLTGLFFLRLYHVDDETRKALGEVAIPLRGFSFCDVAASSVTEARELVVAIPLRGFSFCDVATHARGRSLRHRVAIPLRGFSFCDRGRAARGASCSSTLQSPYGAFLFATEATGTSAPCPYSLVAIPLRGFSFCDHVGTCRRWSHRLTQLQSPYGAFLFATCGGATLTRKSWFRGCNPLTGLFFLRLGANGRLPLSG